VGILRDLTDGFTAPIAVLGTVALLGISIASDCPRPCAGVRNRLYVGQYLVERKVISMGAAPVAHGKDVFTLDPRETALLVIDMQNAFVAEGAAYETPKARVMIPNIERLLGFARTQNMPIVWTRSDHRPPYSGILINKCPAVREDEVCWPGHESFDFYSDMPQPQDGEFEVVKHKYDAFHETDMDAILRNQGVKTVIIVGTATNVCCDSTARAAFMRDYQVAFLSDATASFNDVMHEVTLQTMEMLFGRVMTVAEAVSEMQEQLARSQDSPVAIA
jgi:ureidoacrylate peracid hydrolase